MYKTYNMEHRTKKRERRHKRIRVKVVGITNRPRLSIFRSNRFVYGQIIDDTVGRTLLSVHSKTVSGVSKGKTASSKSDNARTAGQELARKALEKQIKRITFDRGGAQYQGRVQAFAEGAREGGLEF